MPHIASGRTQSSYLVNGTQDPTFVVGLSSEIINYIGMLFIFSKSFICFLISYLFSSHLIRFLHRQYNILSAHDNDYLDVKATTLLVKLENSTFLNYYIKKF